MLFSLCKQISYQSNASFTEGKLQICNPLFPAVAAV